MEEYAWGVWEKQGFRIASVQNRKPTCELLISPFFSIRSNGKLKFIFFNESKDSSIFDLSSGFID